MGALWATIKFIALPLLWTAVYIYSIYLVIAWRLPWVWTFLMLALLTFGLILEVKLLSHRVRFAYHAIMAVIAGYRMLKMMEEFFGEGNVKFRGTLDEEEECPPPVDVILGKGDVGDYVEYYTDEDGVEKARWKKC